MRYGKHIASIPQSQPVPGKNMTRNQAGGFVFEADAWKRLRRFLILGTEGGSYYQSEKELTIANVASLDACLKEDFKKAIDLIVEVSDKGLAPKNDSAVFSLAYASVKGSEKARKYAFSQLQKVCRIGTHIFQFVQAREDLGGGWGRGMREAIGDWYLNRAPGSLILQALKYQQRNGVSHRDLLRLSHPKATTDERRAIFSAIVLPDGGDQKAPSPGAKEAPVRNSGGGWKAIASSRLVEGYLKIQSVQNASDAAQIIRDHELERELVPTQFLTDPKVWEALLPHMKIGALTRNLGNLSKCGLLVPLSNAAKTVSARFTNQEDIRASRLHPYAILVASKIYASGKGLKGSGTWIPVPQVVDALDTAFDLAFQNVEPTGKRFLLAVDVSASMSWLSNGGPILSCEGAAAMALAVARVEQNYHIMGFAEEFRDLRITAKDSLATALQKTRAMNMGGTDTTVAIRWALQNNIQTDVFGVFSDGETWAGNQHTFLALEEYRKKTGIPAKLAVVNFVANQTSIIDPSDFGSMDFIGFDASLPQALAAFVTE